MKKIIIFLCTILFTPAFAQEPVDSRQREIVIRSVNVVPMEKEEVLTNQTVVIKDGKIAAIGNKAKYNSNALIIDGTGK